MRRRRSRRSASDPPRRLKKANGRISSAKVSPSETAEPVR
jgi:hypothetical protein